MSEKHSFTSEQRIRKQCEIQQIFRLRRRITGIFFSIQSRLNNFNYPRLAIIVSKKNIRLAVQRNRIKRYIREYFRLHQTAVAGIDMIVVVDKKAGVATSKELDQCLENLFSELRNRLKSPC